MSTGCTAGRQLLQEFGRGMGGVWVCFAGEGPAVAATPAGGFRLPRRPWRFKSFHGGHRNPLVSGLPRPRQEFDGGS